MFPLLLFNTRYFISNRVPQIALPACGRTGPDDRRSPCRPVLRPAEDLARGFALAPAIANAVLICTGAAVRLSSPRLGRPDWPRCTKASMVAARSAGQTTLNTWVGSGNRLLNFPLMTVAGPTFIACPCDKPRGARCRDLSVLLPGVRAHRNRTPPAGAGRRADRAPRRLALRPGPAISVHDIANF